MTITRADVADLQPGDVVELRLTTGTTIRGSLTDERGYGHLGIAGAGWNVRSSDGLPAFHVDDGVDSLTVVSRAPRPLYVNHPRTSPVPGDVVRDEDSDDPMRVWLTSSNEDGDTWWVDYNAEWVDKSDLPDRLRLLVDGETGQVVP